MITHLTGLRSKWSHTWIIHSLCYWEAAIWGWSTRATNTHTRRQRREILFPPEFRRGGIWSLKRDRVPKQGWGSRYSHWWLRSNVTGNTNLYIYNAEFWLQKFSWILAVSQTGYVSSGLLPDHSLSGNKGEGAPAHSSLMPPPLPWHWRQPVVIRQDSWRAKGFVSLLWNLAGSELQARFSAFFRAATHCEGTLSSVLSQFQTDCHHASFSISPSQWNDLGFFPINYSF
jgi:hypothetical protein